MESQRWPPSQPERLQSFDPVASVHMLRYDLNNFGRILPETFERVHDEELSLLVEAMGRASRTEFPLKRMGNDLAYFKNGEWQSYTAMVVKGEQVARLEAQADPRKQFLFEDAVTQLQHAYRMRSLQPGQQHVWCSPYRQDIEDRYGAPFMKECGRFPDRKMAFIYRAYCNEDGDVILQSQTVDQSNDQALARVVDAAQTNPAIQMDELVHIYDAILAQTYGGMFYAGRRNAEINENAWQSMKHEADLIEYFLAGLESIARSSLVGVELEETTKRHIYGVWATFKNRLGDGKNFRLHVKQGMGVAQHVLLQEEVRANFTDFAARGEALIGCGGSILTLLGETDILAADPKDVFSAIFGSKEDADCSYVSKKCPMCGTANVETTDKKVSGDKRQISGKCGCSKVYVKPNKNRFALAT